jgi:hypothetical protein
MELLNLLKRPSAYLPLVMSAGALAVVTIAVLLFGVGPQQDEGTAAHIFQLLIGLQVPIALLFAFIWFPKFPKQTLAVISLQIAAALLALVPVAILGL